MQVAELTSQMATPINQNVAQSAPRTKTAQVKPRPPFQYEVKCFVRQGHDHIAKLCPNKCHKCGKSGHVPGKCVATLPVSVNFKGAATNL